MPDPPEPQGTPRWVKILGTLTVAVILLVLVAQFVTGGKHGPMRHLSPPATETQP